MDQLGITSAQEDEGVCSWAEQWINFERLEAEPPKHLNALAIEGVRGAVVVVHRDDEHDRVDQNKDVDDVNRSQPFQDVVQVERGDSIQLACKTKACASHDCIACLTNTTLHT